MAWLYTRLVTRVPLDPLDCTHKTPLTQITLEAPSSPTPSRCRSLPWISGKAGLLPGTSCQHSTMKAYIRLGQSSGQGSSWRDLIILKGDNQNIDCCKYCSYSVRIFLIPATTICICCRHTIAFVETSICISNMKKKKTSTNSKKSKKSTKSSTEKMEDFKNFKTVKNSKNFKNLKKFQTLQD